MVTPLASHSVTPSLSALCVPSSCVSKGCVLFSLTPLHCTVQWPPPPGSCLLTHPSSAGGREITRRVLPSTLSDDDPALNPPPPPPPPLNHPSPLCCAHALTLTPACVEMCPRVVPVSPTRLKSAWLPSRGRTERKVLI